jgi:hypothetical protein
METQLPPLPERQRGILLLRDKVTRLSAGSETRQMNEARDAHG